MQVYRSGGCIPEALHALAHEEWKPCWILIRGWDSQRDPEKIQTIYRGFGLEGAVHLAGLLIEVQDPREFVSFAGTLHGFDEVWIGHARTDWNALAHLPAMTSEVVHIDGPGSSPFLEAYRKASATWAFGDGAGINVIGPYRLFSDTGQ